MFVNAYREQLIAKFGLEFKAISAKNNKIQLDTGETIFDFLSQYGVLPFGHHPDFLVKHLQKFFEQSQPIFIQPNVHPILNQCAQALINAVSAEHYSRCVSTNSGAETVEAALKLARMKTGRKKILSVYGGFHGKTFAALSATGSERFKAPHIHDSSHYDYVSANDLVQLKQKLSSKKYAAFIVEPILGEGGMLNVSHAFLKAAIQYCQESGTLSIFDEIQTGIGRLGDICAAKLFQIFPDCILFSKALGGGIVPTGMMIYQEHCYHAKFEQKHSSTFANNGLAAWVAYHTIQHLCDSEQNIFNHVRSLSHQVDQHIDQLLLKYAHILDVTGAGLMRAYTFYDSRAEQNIIINFCQHNGSLAYIICAYLLKVHHIYVMPLLSQPCSIRFEPPLNISAEDLAHFLNTITEVCELIDHGRYDILFAHLIDLDSQTLPTIEVEFPVSLSPEAKIAATHLSSMSKEMKNLKQGKRFAFFIHTTSAEDLAYAFPYAIKQNYSAEASNKLASLILDIARIDYSPDVGAYFSVYNQHSYANGMFIFSPLTPKDMIKLSSEEKLQLMLEYFAIAREHQVELIGLGAYTSVISDGGLALLPFSEQMVMTNGNSLTALATVHSVFSLIQDQDVSNHNAVVVGARGSVGKLAVAGLAHKYGQLILVGRLGSEERIKQEVVPYLIQSCLESEQPFAAQSFFDKLRACLLNEHLDPKHMQIEQSFNLLSTLGLRIETDYQLAFTQADAVISATSEGKAFLNTAYLKKDAIVFDAARPFDFVADQPFKVFEGGLVRQPNRVMYSDCNMVRATAGVNLACLSETLALALEDVEQHQSLGKTISYHHASQILEIALKHGFQAVEYQAEKTASAQQS